MRKRLVLVCALTLLFSPFFFAYLEAEHLLGWPEDVYRWFDPWLPLALILFASVVTLTLRWTIGVFGESDRH